MRLINCKVELLLEWYQNCILSSAGTAAVLTIIDTKIYAPFITLRTEDNLSGANLTTENSYDKYLLIRLKIDNYNIENGRNFYD